MIEHIERYPRVRDRAIFVGDPDGHRRRDRFGAGAAADPRRGPRRHYELRRVRHRVRPARRSATARAPRRARLRRDEPVCIVAVGGSGVGARAAAARDRRAAGAPSERVPGLRMVVVAGPADRPGALPDADGLEVRGYVHELYRHLAACDVAVVQGGLTTTMELVGRAAGRSSYFPLEHHFEQQVPRPPPPRALRRAGVAAVGAGDARTRSPTRSPRRGRPVRATGRCPTPAWRGRRTRSPGCWSPPSGGRTAP